MSSDLATAFVIPPDDRRCRTATWRRQGVTVQRHLWAYDDQLLALLYQVIGCDTVDTVPLYLEEHELIAWVDDNGLFADPVQPNPRASQLAQFLGRPCSLVGTVVLTGGADDDGAPLGVPADVLAKLLATLGPVNAS